MGGCLVVACDGLCIMKESQGISLRGLFSACTIIVVVDGMGAAFPVEMVRETLEMGRNGCVT